MLQHTPSVALPHLHSDSQPQQALKLDPRLSKAQGVLLPPGGGKRAWLWCLGGAKAPSLSRADLPLLPSVLPPLQGLPAPFTAPNYASLSPCFGVPRLTPPSPAASAPLRPHPRPQARKSLVPHSFQLPTQAPTRALRHSPHVPLPVLMSPTRVSFSEICPLLPSLSHMETKAPSHRNRLARRCTHRHRPRPAPHARTRALGHSGDSRGGRHTAPRLSVHAHKHPHPWPPCRATKGC